jgi:exopolysaccharide production protein ExoZ
MYWLMTIVTAAIALAAPALLQTTRFSWDALLCSFLFLPIASAPLLHLGWTLDYEMFFYVVFALCLGFAPWRRTGVLALAFGGLILLVGQLHPKPAMLDFYANSITFEFLFGCLIGCAYLDGWLRRIPLAASIALLILGVGALAFGGINDDGLSNRAVLRGLPAFVIVLSLLSIEQHVSLQSRPLHRIGDATYSIYLTHIFVVAGLRKAWNLAHLPTGGLAIYVYVALCVSIATGVGVVAFNSVERRLTSIGKRVARV